jgi:hypothetical protein
MVFSKGPPLNYCRFLLITINRNSRQRVGNEADGDVLCVLLLNVFVKLFEIYFWLLQRVISLWNGDRKLLILFRLNDLRF